jgi:hypothetical protein
MPLRHSKASKWAAEQKKLKDQRPNAENRVRMNSQEEIDALADLIIQVERGRQPQPQRQRRPQRSGNGWSDYTYTEVKRSA